MLIVNKEENGFINMDNVNYIRIEEITDFDGGATGTFAITNGKCDLGEYGDIIRCQEILTEIINYYCVGKKVYYMPKE